MFIIFLLSLVVPLTILYYFQYCKKWREKFGHLEKIGGPRKFPLIGSAWMMLLVPATERLKHVATLLEKYDGLCVLWLGSDPLIVCASAEDAEVVLGSRVNIDKSFYYDCLKSWLGTGLLTSGGPKWHQRRKLLTPAFHFSVLESFLPIITEHSKTFVQKLKRMENREEEWDILPFVKKFTLDVICETAMGVKMNIQNSESSKYLQNVTIMGSVIMEKVMKPWWKYQFIYSYTSLYKREKKALRVLHEMSMDVIQKNKLKRQAARKSGPVDPFNDHNEKNKKAFLDLLLDISEESQVHLTDEDIREEVDTFMFEGHDTTTSGISSTIHFLSSHPQIQATVAEELFSVFGDSDRDPTLHDISKLKYLECVIRESHRLLPPVPVVGRKLSEPVVLGGKYLIPADTTVDVSIYTLNRREKYFPNSETFDPNNFAAENSHLRSPFSFVPFSAGPRNCIGQKFAMLEEKVVLSSLLRNYELKSSQKTEDLGTLFELVLRHGNGVLVTVSPRVWTD